MADHHRYLASSTATPPIVPLLSPLRPSFASSSATPPKVPVIIKRSPSLAKFRAPALIVPKDYLSLSPPGTVPSRKRKLDQELTKAFTAAAADDDGLALKLYEDQWKIKKKLKQSDINGNSRLLLPIKSVEGYILPLMGENLARLCRSDEGLKVEVWDADESSEHHLVLKKWNNTRYFVLTGNWIKDFVRRRGLEKGDEVGLTFDGTNIFFKLLNKN
ncbi:hypothetical protein LguiB_028846 [Lonicera macranthoides]